ncbi:hypothetical protein Tco_1294457 [Tanacetum coccineum]
MDSILEDSVDKYSLDDNLDDTISEMFTDEHALDYSSPPLWDDYDDELFDLETCDSVFYEDFSKVDALSSTNNEDKITNASLILEDFNPPLYELPFHKEVPGLRILLSFSSENKENVFNPEILTSKRVHTSFSQNYLIGALKLSKSSKFLKARWRFFLAHMERTFLTWMFHVSISIPLDQLKISRIFEASRARGFVLRSQELHILSFILGIRYPNLID